ncbi:MAG: hypothetical protein PHS44_00995 [Candidatus Dojkabacteria bacterium]|jgi:hypothetical protein|nr:hypothetical protein [Candidatus Dojkabacteria bacterium]
MTETLITPVDTVPTVPLDLNSQGLDCKALAGEALEKYAKILGIPIEAITRVRIVTRKKV